MLPFVPDILPPNSNPIEFEGFRHGESMVKYARRIWEISIPLSALGSLQILIFWFDCRWYQISILSLLVVALLIGIAACICDYNTQRDCQDKRANTCTLPPVWPRE